MRKEKGPRLQPGARIQTNPVHIFGDPSVLVNAKSNSRLIHSGLRYTPRLGRFQDGVPGAEVRNEK